MPTSGAFSWPRMILRLKEPKQNVAPLPFLRLSFFFVLLSLNFSTGNQAVEPKNEFSAILAKLVLPLIRVS